MRSLSLTSAALALAVALALALVLPAAAQAQDQDAAAEGRDLALEACGRCHSVGAAPTAGPAAEHAAPSFAVIAADPQASRAWLAPFVTKPHWDEKALPAHMPLTWLSESQADAVASYILSLKK